MAFDYKKIKQKQAEDGSFWTSYSDLFMVLSVVFLLLYVVASLRSGTFSVQQQLENKKLSSEAQDLKKQIQAYNAIKDDYLEKEASEAEAKMYEELMSKLSLLQDEAHQEKRQLEAQAQENAAKAQALNQYQQMVRNIINTNLLSKKKIKIRNELIDKKNDAIKEMDTTITEQTREINEKAQVISQKENLIASQEKDIQAKQKDLENKRSMIKSLEVEITEKSQTIKSNQNKITALNDDLGKKIKELETTHNSAVSSKADLSRKIAIMKLENAKKINELNSQTQNMQQSVAAINQQLNTAAGQLKDANSKLSAQEAEKKRLESEMAQANANYQKNVDDMNKQFAAKMDAQRSALEKQLEGEKASAAEKMKRLGEFKDKMAKEKAALDGQLADLKGQVANAKDELGKAAKEADGYKQKLADAQKDHGRYIASIDALQKANDGLSGDLKRAKEILDAKKKLADKIAKDLAAKGIKAGVDGKTGDVTINFGDEYFDTGKSDLKNNMKNILQKFVPTYSRSLFSDEKIAKEIHSVEIIGFSSPTYKGRYVDPQSLNESDRTAVSYNLDLSYNRAKSIFSYIFDKKNMTYQHQKELLPLVKVTGRSFLAEEVKGRDIASGLSHKDYCAKYSCEKSQKVIIKFNLKD